MKWFQDVSKVVSSAGRYIHWVSPSGFPVKQDYKKLRGSEVRTWISGKVVSVCFTDETDKISPRKMANGVAPNVVHSLDSTLLHLTTVSACKKKGIYDFSMIHDSYGTHSTKAQALADTIREEAVNLFSRDLLKEWLDQLKKQHPDLDFPALPKYGDADLSLIAESPYFFS
jgi:DNA-directed RNA polymerase